MPSISFSKALICEQVKKIQNKDIQSLVSIALSKGPQTFWSKPSSKFHHHLDERGEGGNVLHTIRVIKLVELICNCTSLSQNDKDEIRAAAILHDVMKFGLNGDTNVILTNEHPRLMAEWLSKEFKDNTHVVNICSIIEKHMGKWGIPIYNVNLRPEDILHLADCLEVQDCLKVEV